MTATLTTRPTFAIEPTTVTAGDIKTGDWLVEILSHHGIRGLEVKALITDITDGPILHGAWADSPSVARVYVRSYGRHIAMLLPVTHPVVIRRRIS